MHHSALAELAKKFVIITFLNVSGGFVCFIFCGGIDYGFSYLDVSFILPRKKGEYIPLVP